MAKQTLQIFSVTNGREVVDPFDANQVARHAALLSDRPHGRSVTKPRVATELSKYRLCLHESSHACLANLAFGRPIVRVTIDPDDKGNIGHTWSYHNGKANRDDLVIVAAGRIAEEELLGDVYEIGCTGDDEILRSLALKLGDANTLLRETEASARELVKQYAATIRRFALRLAAKREFVLDQAEAAIRLAHEEVTQRAVLDEAWQKKIARAQAEISVRKYKEEQAKAKSGKVKRTSYDFSKREDVVAFNIQLGRDPNSEPIGYTAGYILNGEHK